MNVANISSTKLFTNFRQQSYWIKNATVVTLITGIYLHVTSRLIKRNLFIQHVLTPRLALEEN